MDVLGAKVPTGSCQWRLDPNSLPRRPLGAVSVHKPTPAKRDILAQVLAASCLQYWGQSRDSLWGKW